MRFIFTILLAVSIVASARSPRTPKPTRSTKRSTRTERVSNERPSRPKRAGIAKRRPPESSRDAVQKLRNIQSIDPAWIDSAPHWLTEWTELADAELARMPFDGAESIRGVAEIRTPKTDTQKINQREEAAHFQSLGYNALLAVWDGEPVSSLADELRYFRSDGWRIIVAFGQPEPKNRRRPYRPVPELRKEFSRLLVHADAFLPTWRGTSPPHGNVHMNATYVTQVSAIARQAVPDIPIIQDAYFMRGKLEPPNMVGFSSAILSSNTGYYGARPEGIADMIRDHTGREEIPLLGMIIGPVPYYESHYKSRTNLKTEGEIWETKQQIESRFSRAGWGIILLVGDGAGNTDTLTKSTWRIDK